MSRPSFVVWTVCKPSELSRVACLSRAASAFRHSTIADRRFAFLLRAFSVCALSVATAAAALHRHAKTRHSWFLRPIPSFRAGAHFAGLPGEPGGISSVGGMRVTLCQLHHSRRAEHDSCRDRRHDNGTQDLGNRREYISSPQPDMLSHEAACFLNATDQDARVSITIYLHDREPAGPCDVLVPARRPRHVRFNNLTDAEPIPLATEYLSVFPSDVPIVVQHTRLNSRQAENAMMTTIAVAGEAQC